MNNYFSDLELHLRKKYEVDNVSIYYQYGTESPVLINGQPIIYDLIIEYLSFTLPRYIVAEQPYYLNYANGVCSRFVYHFSYNNLSYLIVLSSPEYDYFDNKTHEIMKDMLFIQSQIRKDNKYAQSNISSQ